MHVRRKFGGLYDGVHFVRQLVPLIVTRRENSLANIRHVLTNVRARYNSVTIRGDGDLERNGDSTLFGVAWMTLRLFNVRRGVLVSDRVHYFKGNDYALDEPLQDRRDVRKIIVICD